MAAYPTRTLLQTYEKQQLESLWRADSHSFLYRLSAAYQLPVLWGRVRRTFDIETG